MATKIKFDVERMKEINQQMDDLKSKLSTSMEATQENLLSLEGNIQGTGINKTITAYRENNDGLLKSILKSLGLLVEYLEGQIVSYKTEEEDAINTIDDFAKKAEEWLGELF